MSEYEYYDTVAKKVDEIRDAALHIVQKTHPEIKYVIDRRTIDDYSNKIWDYPGKWYLEFKLPNGFRSKEKLIEVIVADTIQYFSKGKYYAGGIMNGKNYSIRLEQKEDFRKVENLVRESFWNVYRPGCYEHYVIHVLREDPAFVKELDFVMEQDGSLVGQNMFMKTDIKANDGRDVPVLTMGPVSITPKLKRKGYGKILLDYSVEKAAALGFGALLFEGNIDFYGKCGFDYAGKFGIRYHDLPEDADSSFFLCKELIPGYLDGVTGVYLTPQGYYVNEADVEEFDKQFPPKEKLKLPGQIF